jgi:hypothetical protein
MTEVVVTCTRCGTRRAFRGSDWEIAVAADVWLTRHRRARHHGEQVPARTSKAWQGVHTPARGSGPQRRVRGALRPGPAGSGRTLPLAAQAHPDATGP